MWLVMVSFDFWENVVKEHRVIELSNERVSSDVSHGYQFDVESISTHSSLVCYYLILLSRDFILLFCRVTLRFIMSNMRFVWVCSMLFTEGLLVKHGTANLFHQKSKWLLSHPALLLNRLVYHTLFKLYINYSKPFILFKLISYAIRFQKL